MSTNAERLSGVRVWVDGGLNATSVDPHNHRASALAAFLESDVQASEGGSRFFIETLDAVLAGERECEGGRGNAFAVTIDHEGVLIENEYLEELNSFRYTHEEYRTALEQALTAILEAKRRKLSSGLVSSLDE